MYTDLLEEKKYVAIGFILFENILKKKMDNLGTGINHQSIEKMRIK